MTNNQKREFLIGFRAKLVVAKKNVSLGWQQFGPMHKANLWRDGVNRNRDFNAQLNGVEISMNRLGDWMEKHSTDDVRLMYDNSIAHCDRMIEEIKQEIGE